MTSATVVERRWGALVSGWLIALPLTSGPIALFISLELGPTAGRQAATGALIGATAQVAFAGGYALASRHVGWLSSLVAASIGFLLASVALALLVPAEAALLFVLALTCVAGGLIGLRGTQNRPRVAFVQPGRWDIPARAVVATTLVVAISGIAPVTGGHAAGIIATYPVYISVLTSFAHRLGGSPQATGVLRGLLLGLPGYATFFLVVSAAVLALPVPVVFSLALAAALSINTLILTATVVAPRLASPANSGP